jgi:hypothetical protein
MATGVGTEPEAQSAAAGLERFAAWYAEAPKKTGIALGRGYQAKTELFQSPAGRFVLKRARGVSLWRLLGEVAIRREYEIYRRIRGVRGVPRCLGLLDDRILVIEYIDGATFRKHEPQLKDWDTFFAKLFETIQGVHAAGVAHGDLNRKDNILVGPGEQPYIVDFGVASFASPVTAFWANAVFRWMRQYDYNAWVKLKNRRQLDDLPAADAALYRPTWMERIARAIRVVWQKLTLRRLRRKLWPRDS